MLKRLQAKGLGGKKRQAEGITQEEENKLWEAGQLGDYCVLLWTIFALRSGLEHRQLHLSPPPIQLFERPGERAYLRYQEDLSKNHTGGLKGRKITPKMVYHHQNFARALLHPSVQEVHESLPA